MTKLRALWSGDLPLGEAFWTWTIGVGVLVYLTTTVLFLTLVTIDAPWPALFGGPFPVGALQHRGRGRRLALGRALPGPGRLRRPRPDAPRSS